MAEDLFTTFLHYIIFVMINCEWCQHERTIDIYVLYLHHWSEIYSSKLKWNDSLVNDSTEKEKEKSYKNNNNNNKKLKKNVSIMMIILDYLNAYYLFH